MNEREPRVVLITGAASGMGRAHALRFAQDGVRVAIQDIDETGLAQTAAKCAALDAEVEVHCFDVSDIEAIRTMIEAVESRWNGIDVVINNAGFARDRVLEDIAPGSFDKMIGVHVKGAFFCTRYAVPRMKKRGWGRIINVSSRWAMAGHETASDYVAAKGAILGLTKAWAKELAPHGITVNAVAPGGVWSRMVLESIGEDGVRQEEKLVPLGRWAQPEEISEMMVYLASEEAGFVTGQVLSPNGGKTMVGF